MKQNNCAETVDRVQRGVARGMLVCGLTYLFLLWEELTDKGRLNEILDFTVIIGSVLTVAVTFISLWPVIKQKLTGKILVKNEPESFVSGAMLASFKNGWIALTLSLVVLIGMSKFIESFDLSLRSILPCYSQLLCYRQASASSGSLVRMIWKTWRSSLCTLNSITESVFLERSTE